MSVRLEVRFKGIEKLAKTLEALPKSIARQCIRKASREAAKVGQRYLKSIAPVGKSETKSGFTRQKRTFDVQQANGRRKPGELRRSIKVRATKRSRRWVGAVVTISRKLGQDGFYAGFVEWGTKYPKSKKGTRKSGLRVQPTNWMEKGIKRKTRMMHTVFRRTFYAHLPKAVADARRKGK